MKTLCAQDAKKRMKKGECWKMAKTTNPELIKIRDAINKQFGFNVARIASEVDNWMTERISSGYGQPVRQAGFSHAGND